MITDLPIYKAVINEMDEGITAISFVHEPAVESNFLEFAKQKRPLKFSVLDETNRKVIAPIMRCDFPIYRYNEQVGEHYVIYDKQTIEIMARKMLADNVQDMNIEHNPNNRLTGCYLTELFIKDTAKGINPKGYEDIEDYSLFGVYTIENNDAWENIKNGNWGGISLEGYFSFEEDEKQLLEEILSMLKQLDNK